MADYLIALLLALVVGIIYFLSNKLDLKHRGHPQRLYSFSAGVSITYILLELFPLFTEQAQELSKFLFIFVLLGFIAHHLIEKEIYQHNKQHELVKKLGLEEQGFSFIYHFILGMVLVAIIGRDLVAGFLFFIPILLFVFISTLQTNPHRSKLKAYLLSGSTFFGALLATFIWKNIPAWTESALIGLVVGVLLFTITRHHIPFGRRGKIGYFSLGFIIYSLIIMISWYF